MFCNKVNDDVGDADQGPMPGLVKCPGCGELLVEATMEPWDGVTVPPLY